MSKSKQINNLYFMSASDMWKNIIGKDEEGKELFTYEVEGAEEVVIARDEEWAKKIASKQNSNYPAEKWKVTAVYSLDDLGKLLSEKDHAIIKLGSSY